MNYRTLMTEIFHIYISTYAVSEPSAPVEHDKWIKTATCLNRLLFYYRKKGKKNFCVKFEGRLLAIITSSAVSDSLNSAAFIIGKVSHINLYESKQKVKEIDRRKSVCGFKQSIISSQLFQWENFTHISVFLEIAKIYQHKQYYYYY